MGRLAALRPVFTHLNGEHDDWVMRPAEQDGTLRMPQAGDLSLSDKDCKLLLDGLVQALRGLSPTP